MRADIADLIWRTVGFSWKKCIFGCGGVTAGAERQDIGVTRFCACIMKNSDVDGKGKRTGLPGATATDVAWGCTDADVDISTGFLLSGETVIFCGWWWDVGKDEHVGAIFDPDRCFQVQDEYNDKKYNIFIYFVHFDSDANIITYRDRDSARRTTNKTVPPSSEVFSHHQQKYLSSLAAVKVM